VIGRLPLKVGSLVGPSDQTPLTTISDTSEIFAYFAMNEKEYFDFLEKSPGASMPEKLKIFRWWNFSLPTEAFILKKEELKPLPDRLILQQEPFSSELLSLMLRNC
jgi:hypothetical protein